MDTSIYDFGEASQAMRKAASEMAQKVAEDLERRMMRGNTAMSPIGDLSNQDTTSATPDIDTGKLMSMMSSLSQDEIEPSLRMFSSEQAGPGQIRWKGHQPYWVPFGAVHMPSALLIQSCGQSVLDLRASMMRCTADVDPELIRNAEIRAVIDVS